MKGSIRISEKHGVNPSLGVCFWCGQENGEICLLGRLPKDAAAPRHMVVSYEPCEKCKAWMAQGVTFAEKESEESAPTGRWMVLKEEAVRRMLRPEVVEGVIQGRKAFIEPALFDLLRPKED